MSVSQTLRERAVPSIKCAPSSGGEHTGLWVRKASVGLSTLWFHASSSVDSVLALPQSGVCGSRGSSASLVCHVGLCFIVRTDHCSLRSKRSTRGSWNLLKCKRLTFTVYVYYFLSFHLTFFKCHIPLTFKRGDWLDQVLKVQMRKCAWDTPAQLCCPARLRPGPASEAFPAHLRESDTHALCRGQRSVAPSWVFPFCFLKKLCISFDVTVLSFGGLLHLVSLLHGSSIRPHSVRQCSVYE